jgi:glycosyltransferase involved in cell wall biosynthesis
MPLVSVIIPIYNVDQYLRQCLDSVINQTLKDIEIICVNDGSTDNSLQILEEYAQKDNRIKVVLHKHNKGVGAARNTGLEFVTGEYVLFLDSDDWLELDACECAYNHIKKNKNDIVYFGINIYNEETDKLNFDFSRLYSFRGNFYNTCLKLNSLTRPYMDYCECWYKIYKSSFLQKYDIKFTNGHRKYEDQPFYFKALLYANTVSILDKPLYNYRIRETSISQSTNSWDDLIETRKQILDELLKSEIADKKFIDFYVISCTHSLFGYYNRFKNKNKKYEKHMYSTMRKFFILLDKKNNLQELGEFINYKRISKIIKYNYEIYKLNKYAKSIIGSYNKNGKYKVLKLFGIGIVLKQY